MNDRIVVVGSLNMDLVCEVDRAPEAGETVSGRRFLQIPGGKGANQAVAAARLGGSVAMVGCVGGDEFGTRLRSGLVADGVAVDCVRVETGISTGVAMILVDAQAQNRIVVVAGANEMLIAAHVDAARALIEKAALVLLQLEVPLASVERTVAIAAAAGRPVVLNPAPAQPLPDELLAKVSYLVPNETEAALLTGIEVRDEASAVGAAQALRSRGVGTVLLTLGAAGVLIADAQGTRLIAAPKVDPIDTTAAGDTFIGALSVGLVEGMTVDAAAQLAVRAASIAVTRVGAQTSIPYRREL